MTVDMGDVLRAWTRDILDHFDQALTDGTQEDDDAA